MDGLIATRLGKPAEAEQILRSVKAGIGVEATRYRFNYDDFRSLFAAVASEIALTYEDNDETGKATTVFDWAVSALEAFPDTSEHFNASHLARFSPERAGQYLDKQYDLSVPKHTLEERERLKAVWLWEGHISSYAQRGRVRQLLEYYGQQNKQSSSSVDRRTHLKLHAKQYIGYPPSTMSFIFRGWRDLTNGCSITTPRYEFR